MKCCIAACIITLIGVMLYRNGTVEAVRQPSSVPDEVYDILILIVNDSFDVPVKQRTPLHLKALRQYYRYKNKHKLTMDSHNSILLDGIKLLRRSEEEMVTKTAYNDHHGAGVRTLMRNLREDYSGLSENRLMNVLKNYPLYHQMQVKFTNKVPITPIHSSRVLRRIQIDLVDKSFQPSHDGKKTYRYILSVIDVCSRYVWLRKLEKKSSKAIATHLKELFAEHGEPEIVQHDQGKEFDGHVKLLLKERGIQQIKSSPYHPESQGKVERMHRDLKNIMKFEIVKDKQLQWAKNLKKYELLLNNRPKSILGGFTPYAVYHGREKKHRGFSGNKIRSTANKAGRRFTEKLIKRQEQQYQTPTYKVGQQLLVRQSSSTRNNLSNKSKFTTGRVVKRSHKCYKYKVELDTPNGSKPQKWIHLKDLMGETVRSQAISTSTSKSKVTAKPLTKKSFYITSKDRRDNIVSDFGLDIAFNPSGDGNCLFAALGHQLQLQSYSVHVNSSRLRRDAVNYLVEHPYLGAQTETRWSELITESALSYIARMSRSGTHGDQLILQAISQMFNIQILVVSSLNGGTTLITPAGGSAYNWSMDTLVLGHYAEDHGQHYVSLQPDQDSINRIILRSPQIDIISESPEQVTPVHLELDPPEITTSDQSDTCTKLPTDITPEECTTSIDTTTHPEVPHTPILPPEIWHHIIKHAISSSLITAQYLSCVCTVFRDAVNRYRMCPKIHINPSYARQLQLPVEFQRLSFPYNFSLRSLQITCGKFSGTVMATKKALNDVENMRGIFVSVVFVGLGWYEIRRIFWRKK